MSEGMIESLGRHQMPKTPEQAGVFVFVYSLRSLTSWS